MIKGSHNQAHIHKNHMSQDLEPNKAYSIGGSIPISYIIYISI